MCPEGFPIQVVLRAPCEIGGTGFARCRSKAGGTFDALEQMKEYRQMVRYFDAGILSVFHGYVVSNTKVDASYFLNFRINITVTC